jgi:hypothetical protein
MHPGREHSAEKSESRGLWNGHPTGAVYYPKPAFLNLSIRVAVCEGGFLPTQSESVADEMAC